MVLVIRIRLQKKMLIIRCVILDDSSKITSELYGDVYGCPSETSDPDPPGLTTVVSGPSHPCSSSLQASEIKASEDKTNDIQGPMNLTLNVKNMVPTQPPKRRRFSKAEKEHINRVRKEGACEVCRKKHRKVCRAPLEQNDQGTY